MGKIEGLALRQGGFQVRPHGFLACIGLEILNDGPSPGRLHRRKQRFSRYESFINGLLPVIVTFAHDDPDAVILHVQGLTATLNAVADNGHDFVLKHLPGFFKRKFLRSNNLLHNSANVDL